MFKITVEEVIESSDDSKYPRDLRLYEQTVEKIELEKIIKAVNCIE